MARFTIACLVAVADSLAQAPMVLTRKTPPSSSALMSQQQLEQRLQQVHQLKQVLQDQIQLQMQQQVLPEWQSVREATSAMAPRNHDEDRQIFASSRRKTAPMSLLFEQQLQSQGEGALVAQEQSPNDPAGNSNSMCFVVAGAVTLVTMGSLVATNGCDRASVLCCVCLLLFTGAGFGGLWRLGLLEEYWQLALLVFYFLVAILWLIGILLLQAEKIKYSAGLLGDPTDTFGELGADEVWKLQDEAPVASFCPVPRKKKTGLCC